MGFRRTRFHLWYMRRNTIVVVLFLLLGGCFALLLQRLSSNTGARHYRLSARNYRINVVPTEVARRWRAAINPMKAPQQAPAREVADVFAGHDGFNAGRKIPIAAAALRLDEVDKLSGLDPDRREPLRMEFEFNEDPPLAKERRAREINDALEKVKEHLHLWAKDEKLQKVKGSLEKWAKGDMLQQVKGHLENWANDETLQEVKDHLEQWVDDQMLQRVKEHLENWAQGLKGPNQLQQGNLDKDHVEMERVEREGQLGVRMANMGLKKNTKYNGNGDIEPVDIVGQKGIEMQENHNIVDKGNVMAGDAMKALEDTGMGNNRVDKFMPPNDRRKRMRRRKVFKLGLAIKQVHGM